MKKPREIGLGIIGRPHGARGRSGAGGACEIRRSMRVGYSRRYKERYQIAKEQVIKDRLGTLTGETRWFDLPEVPTMIELGYKDFVVDTFHCMRAPAGTPPEIVEKLANTCIVVLKEPAFRDKLRSAGFETIANGPDGLRRRIANDIQRYKTIIEKAGIGRV